MVIITCLYLALVYLLFFKFKLLPWNKISQGLTVLIGVIILTGFLVGLQGLTPVSVQGAITGRVVEIAPQVSGRVITVEAEPNITVDEGAVLFSIDAVSFESRVDELEARLRFYFCVDVVVADGSIRFSSITSRSVIFHVPSTASIVTMAS